MFSATAQSLHQPTVTQFIIYYLGSDCELQKAASIESNCPSSMTHCICRQVQPAHPWKSALTVEPVISCRDGHRFQAVVLDNCSRVPAPLSVGHHEIKSDGGRQ